MGRKNYSAGIFFLMLLFVFNAQVFSQMNPYRADPENPSQIPGMKLVWSDEFNVDGKPNPAFWKFENGFARNEELQWYQPENAFCKDGLLVIEARRDTIPNPNFVEGSSDWRKNRKYAYYSSAGIKTPALVEYQFGRIEVRARVDTTKGSWPAIWTLGTSGYWPFCGEVDLMEFYLVAGVPTILANVAWGSSTNRGGTWNSMKTPLSHFLAKDPDWPRKFHVWRMDWNKDSICLYLDDELLNFTSLDKTINPMAPPVNPFLQKHYFLLNLAIGANGGNPEHSKFPFKYEVDYIRIYQNTALEMNNFNVANVFGDNMVIQQEIQAPVWGKANPGAKITLNFAGHTFQAVTRPDGKWMIKMPAEKAGGPYVMSIRCAKEEIVFHNVMVGEVWVASGQSNMSFVLQEARNGNSEVQKANHPEIRFLRVANNISSRPLEDLSGHWQVCDSVSSGMMSAVAYYFARELNKNRHVPVGIIVSAWGSTPSEAWTSAESLLKHPDFRDSITAFRARKDDWLKLYRNFLKEDRIFRNAHKGLKWEELMKLKGPQVPAQKNYPSALYNAMIAPVVPFGIRGFIWYQGENNSKRARQYQTLFPLLINDWREKWHNPDLPFLYAQISSFGKKATEPVESDWALLREAQTKTLKLSKTAMAVTIDIGDGNIHPKNKEDVGKRLYLAARNIAYHEKCAFSGPMYRDLKIKGNEIIISFDHTEKGLICKGDSLKGFAIAGEDRKFHWAEAKISGSSVIVKCSQILHPVAVRYAWSHTPECNLYNSEDLPAVPFRTDHWE